MSKIDAELGVRRIAPDVFVVTHEPFFAANVLIVRMTDGTVVLCSSPYETQETRALVRWVHQTFRPAHIVAFNPHFHFDGTGGNEAYREMGVTTYASEHTQRLLMDHGEHMKSAGAAALRDDDQRRRVQAMRVVAAQNTFSEHDGLTLTFGGEEVRVVYPGAAHTADNLVVWFPSRKLLFGGCMIRGAHSIGFTGDADLERWESSVAVARALGARIVVPGHGRESGPDLFDLTVSVVREARLNRQRPASP